jgi:hypothetical protein
MRCGRLARLAVVVVVAVSATLPGCNIVAPVYYLIEGPPKTPAMYTLPDVPTVVFIDDRNNAIKRNSDILRRRIADETSRRLMKQKLVTTTIRPQDAIAAARVHDRHDKVLSIDGIAESVGAEQIIYVQLVEFTESTDGYTPRPYAVARVKVLDVVNNVRLFPAPGGLEDFHLLEVIGLPQNTELYQNQTSIQVVHQELADLMGEKIAKLFYTHETKEIGSQLDPDRY